MTIKVAINGYGRIGRNVLRAFYEGGKKQDIQIVALNDLGNVEHNAHLTRYDTTHGKFPGTVEVDGDYMIVNGDRIRVYAQRNPAELPWGELGVDVVLECTGFFTTKEKASAHLKGGAKKVIISAPGGKDVDATIVFGVNQDVLKSTDTSGSVLYVRMPFSAPSDASFISLLISSTVVSRLAMNDRSTIDTLMVGTRIA
jgi:glyceraldehyde 3-phosphate dehydrogenase